MTVSLDAFLRTGHLGDLRRGMSKDEVWALLGEPDATGGTSRKYPQPSVFLCGTVELWLRQHPPHELFGVCWQAGNLGNFRFRPACVVVDWAFTPEWTFAQVQDDLRVRGVPFQYGEVTSRGAAPAPLKLQSGVSITFDEEARLWSAAG